MAAQRGYEQYEEGSPEEQADRLSYGDAIRRQAVRDAQAQSHYQQFSFKPAINPVSQQLAEVCMHLYSID